MKKAVNVLLALAIMVSSAAAPILTAGAAGAKNATVTFDFSELPENFNLDTLQHIEFSDKNILTFNMSATNTAKESFDVADETHKRPIKITKETAGANGNRWVGTHPSKYVSDRLSDSRIQVLAMDLYIPYSTWNEGDFIKFSAKSCYTDTDDSVKTAREYSNSTFLKYGSAKLPKNQWFTLKYVVDTRDSSYICYGLYAETANGVETLVEAKNDTNWALPVNSFRMEDQFVTQGASYYIENIRYYDEDFIFADYKVRTLFNEDFENDAYNVTSSAAQNQLNFGIAGASSAVTSSDILDGEEFSALKVITAKGGACWVKNAIPYKPYIANIQRLKYRLFVPEDGNVNKIELSLGSNGQNYTVNLVDPSAGLSVGGLKGEIPVFGEWFDVCLDFNYANNVLVCSTVTADGKTTFFAAQQMAANYAAVGLTTSRIHVQNAAGDTTIYIGSIQYKTLDTMPYVTDFESLANTDLKTNGQLLINTTGTIKPEFAGAPDNSDNTVLRLTSTESTANKTCNWTINPTTNANKNNTVYSVKLYIPDTFGEKDTVMCHLLYNKDHATAATIQQPYQFVICGDLIGGNRNISAVEPDKYCTTYPKNEWFTVAITYNHNTNKIMIELICADGTTHILADNVSALKDTDASAYGLRGVRMEYKPAAEDASVRSIYADDISCSSYSLGQPIVEGNAISLPYNGIGTSAANLLLIGASYMGNTLENIVPKYITSIPDGNGTITLQLPSDAATIKGLLWKDFETMRPIIN